MHFVAASPFTSNALAAAEMLCEASSGGEGAGWHRWMKWRFSRSPTSLSHTLMGQSENNITM